MPTTTTIVLEHHQPADSGFERGIASKTRPLVVVTPCDDPSDVSTDKSSEMSGWEALVKQKLEADADQLFPWRLAPEFLEEASRHDSIAGEVIDSLMAHSDYARHAPMVHHGVAQLVHSIETGQITTADLVRLFCCRAAYAHQLNGTLLQINFTEAIRCAEQMDLQREGSKTLVGPLHGLPFTLKDQFHVENMNTSMGYVGWLRHDLFEGKPMSDHNRNVESELVRLLKSLGAIVIGKTTCMQSLWFGETNNNILGYNRNPVKQTLSSGGSSGGEAAFQALRGSTFGVGTDIGGSVAIPASYTGQNVIATVPGLMCSDIKSLRYVMEAVLGAIDQQDDPEALPIPSRFPVVEAEFNSGPLAFGILNHDGGARPHPPIARALSIVESALKSLGHHVVEWKPPSHVAALALHDSLLDANGHYDVVENINISGEPIMKEIRESFPDNKAQEPRSCIFIENKTLELLDFRQSYHTYWESSKNLTDLGRPVDAVILPVTPTASVIPGKSIYWGYSTIANCLDYSSMAIPVTHADMNIDVVTSDYKPLNEKDALNWTAYDPVQYHGAPAGIQLLGRRFEEEKLLVIADRIVTALKMYQGTELGTHVHS